jgi:hypothetical protein
MHRRQCTIIVRVRRRRVLVPGGVGGQRRGCGGGRAPLLARGGAHRGGGARARRRARLRADRLRVARAGFASHTGFVLLNYSYSPFEHRGRIYPTNFIVS